MKDRTTIFKNIFVTLAIASCFAFTTCETLKNIIKEPAVSFNSADITGISFTDLDLLCKINVANPNAMDIPFPEIGWKLFLNANDFVNGTIKNSTPIKAYGSTIVEVPVSLNYVSVINSVSSLIGATEADYKIATDLKFALPIIGDKIVHLEHEGTIPLFQPPTFTFKGIKTTTSLTKVDYEASWEIENKNSVAMLVNDLSYNLTVNNSQWTAGSTPKGMVIGPKQKQTVAFSGSLSGVAVVASIVNMLSNGTNVTCLCDCNVDIGLDFPGFKNFKYPFSYSGTTKLIK